ncbi:MAG TPA: mitofilin family membrane protein [Stellaceae bacterium]
MTEPAAGELPPALELPRRRRYRALAVVPGAALAVQLAVVLAAPYWAPPLLPLLPWGKASDAKLAQRVHRLETAFDQARQSEAQQASSVDQLGRRIGVLEKKQEEQQRATAKEQQLEPRIAALEAHQKQDEQTIGEGGPRLKQLEDRLAKLEAKPEASPQDLVELRQRLEKFAAADADLASRVQSAENAARVQAGDPADAVLAMALLQIREAIEAGRPFAVEYDTLAALARNRPEFAEAAAPLSDPAKRGVATGMVLGKRLHELAGSIANAQTPPAVSDWGSAALVRLRGLVTIHRIGGAGQSGPEAAVSAAETALASGDLAGAIAALDGLSGAPADAAQAWLQMARQRLAADEAVKHIQTLLVARLERSGEPAATAGPPG